MKHTATIPVLRILTKEELHTVAAFATAVTNQSLVGIQELNGEEWVPMNSLVGDGNFDIEGCYRLVPDIVPGYRPWTPAEAMGQKIRVKGSDAPLYHIHTADVKEAYIGNKGKASYEAILEHYETLDGKPCGVVNNSYSILGPDEYLHTPGEPRLVDANATVRVREADTHEWSDPGLAKSFNWSMVDRYKFVK